MPSPKAYAFTKPVAKKLKQIATNSSPGSSALSKSLGSRPPSVSSQPTQLFLGVVSQDVLPAVFFDPESGGGTGDGFQSSPFHGSPYHSSPYFGGGSGAGGGTGPSEFFVPNGMLPGVGKVVIHRAWKDTALFGGEPYTTLPPDARSTYENPIPPFEVEVLNYTTTLYPAQSDPTFITNLTELYVIFEDSFGTYWILGSATEPENKLIRFELSEDKLYNSSTGNAWMLNEDDDIIKDDDDEPLLVRLIDRANPRYQGYGPDLDPRFEDQPGYRGWGWKVGEGFTEGTGEDEVTYFGQYVILSMEGTARWVEGLLAEPLEPGATFARLDFTSVDTSTWWGNAPNGRPPKTYLYNFGGGETGLPDDIRPVLNVYATLVTTSKRIQAGLGVRAVYDERRNKYVITNVPNTIAATLWCHATADFTPSGLIPCQVDEVIDGILPAPTFNAVNGYKVYGKEGDPVLVHQDAEQPNLLYGFALPNVDTSVPGLAVAMLAADCPGYSAIDGSAYTVTPGRYEVNRETSEPTNGVVILRWSTSGLDREFDEEPDPAFDGDGDPPLVIKRRTVVNDSKTPLRASVTEPIILVGHTEVVRPEDAEGPDALYEIFTPVPLELRSLPLFDENKFQIPSFYDLDGKASLRTIRELLKKLEGYVLENAQSIGKDENEEPEWQDDSTCPPEA